MFFIAFILGSVSGQCQSTAAAQLRLLPNTVGAGAGLFTNVGVGGLGSSAGIIQSCCERNRDSIRRLEKRIDFVENDMGNRFKDEFDQIDDVLDDFQRRIDDLELRKD